MDNKCAQFRIVFIRFSVLREFYEHSRSLLLLDKYEWLGLINVKTSMIRGRNTESFNLYIDICAV